MRAPFPLQINTINERICSKYQAMESRMMEVSEDVAGVLDLEAYIQDSQQAREVLENDIQENEGRMAFLYRFVLPRSVLIATKSPQRRE